MFSNKSLFGTTPIKRVVCLQNDFGKTHNNLVTLYFPKLNIDTSTHCNEQGLFVVHVG